MATQVTIRANDETNPEEFWAALDELYPEVADSVREGDTVVDSSTWEAIQRLDGFVDEPLYVVEPVAETEGRLSVGGDGTYEVRDIQAGGYAVVNAATGQVDSEFQGRDDAIKRAEALNENGD